MRPIDADELKTHKFLAPQVKVLGGRHNSKVNELLVDAYQQGWNDAIDAIIDNAPTVDIKTEVSKKLAKEAREIADENYKYGYEKGKADAERPKGEWLDIYSSHIAYECSCCGLQTPIADYYHYCTNCGAKMRVEHKLNNELEEAENE